MVIADRVEHAKLREFLEGFLMGIGEMDLASGGDLLMDNLFNCEAWRDTHDMSDEEIDELNIVTPFHESLVFPRKLRAVAGSV